MGIWLGRIGRFRGRVFCGGGCAGAVIVQAVVEAVVVARVGLGAYPREGAPSRDGRALVQEG